MSIRTEPCPECKGTTFTEWRSEGDLTCMTCGLVVEARIIDERSEWRTFSDKDNNSADPNRVGGPSNPLLQGLTTTIGREKGDKGASYMLNRIHARANNVDKAMVDAFKQMGYLCEQLNATSAKDRACELYKEVVDNKKLRGRSTAAICAACVFMACRYVNLPRTFKEITAMLGSSVSKTDISRCYKELQRYHQDEGREADLHKQQVQSPKEFAKQYCYALNLTFEVNKVCQEMAHRAMADHMPWDARNPQSVASGIVFIALCLLEIRKQPGGGESKEGGAGGYVGKLSRSLADELMEKVRTASYMETGTIRQAYRDMHPHLDMLTGGYSSKEELVRMPDPVEHGREPPAPYRAPVAAAAITAAAAAAAPAAQQPIKQEH